MDDARERYARFLMRQVAWIVVASCGYPSLSKSSGNDASGIDTPESGVSDPPPSCKDMLATCGLGEKFSCCQAITVLGETFNRGNDPTYPATVSTFVLDKYEVTVGRFRAFVNEGMGTQKITPAPGAGQHPHRTSSGWDPAWNTQLPVDTADLISKIADCDTTYPSTWTSMPGANENKPIGCMTWYEAMAFCIWDGGYLPTEAEWNFAASGGRDQRVYPWSDPANSTAIDCTYANYSMNGSTHCAGGGIAEANEVGSESPKGDGKWHHADLAGNIVEWTLDRNDGMDSAYPLPCNDCANLQNSSAPCDGQTTPSSRTRGGGFFSVSMSVRTFDRVCDVRNYRLAAVGMRCARPQ